MQKMKPRKTAVLGLITVGLLAMAVYLFPSFDKPPLSLTITSPPEDIRKIADTALESYFEQNNIGVGGDSRKAFNDYPLRRSGIGLGYYYFDYGTDDALGGGYLVYRVTVWRNGLTKVEGTPIMDRFWTH